MLQNKHTSKRGFTKLQEHFTDTIFYQIELTAKYCRYLGQQVFEKYNAGVSTEEFSVLDVLYCNPQLCQRDLAKILLKDRANTGKLAKSLEEKGLVKITPDIKNNKPVKILSITKKGTTLIEDSHKLLEPLCIEIEKNFTDEKLDEIKNSLKSFKETISKALKTNI